MDTCHNCLQPIRMLCRMNTGYCCERCEEEMDARTARITDRLAEIEKTEN